jgi:hypothetical protein
MKKVRFCSCHNKVINDATYDYHSDVISTCNEILNRSLKVKGK